MASNRKIMVLPGDGIGTEIMKANMRIIDWLAKYRSIDFDMQEGLVGGAAYDAHGTPLSDETLADSIAWMLFCSVLWAGRNMMIWRLN